MKMQVYKCPEGMNLLEAQQYANRQGWTIVKATWSKGIKKKKVPKTALDFEQLFEKDTSVPMHWNLLYT